MGGAQCSQPHFHCAAHPYAGLQEPCQGMQPDSLPRLVHPHLLMPCPLPSASALDAAPAIVPVSALAFAHAFALAYAPALALAFTLAFLLPLPLPLTELLTLPCPFVQCNKLQPKYQFLEPLLNVRLSSLHEGHANLLCTVPVLTYVTKVTGNRHRHRLTL